MERLRIPLLFFGAATLIALFVLRSGLPLIAAPIVMAFLAAFLALSEAYTR